MHNTVIPFWFEEIDPVKWWKKDPDFDQEIRNRFLKYYEEAAAGRHDDLTSHAEGALTLVIVLDQFPRNMFRDTPKAFATDAKALAIAKAAIADGQDMELPTSQRNFLYMPLEHSEDLADQEQCVALMKKTGDEQMYQFAVKHYGVIKEFGRFPHRNKILGRENTPAEDEYLKDPNAGF